MMMMNMKRKGTNLAWETNSFRICTFSEKRFLLYSLALIPRSFLAVLAFSCTLRLSFFRLQIKKNVK